MIRARATSMPFLLAGVLAVAACRQEPAGTRWLPTPSDALVLDVRYPGPADSPESEDTTCSGVNAWLLRLDLDDVPGWSYTFLFDRTRDTVHGCGARGAACPAGVLADMPLPLGGLTRVMIEGVDAMPDAFALSTAGGVTVVCRGMADRTAIPGSIVETAPPTPVPQPSPGYGDPVRVDATVRVVRVGAFNRPFGDVLPPATQHGAAASLTSVADGIGLAERGRVLGAGGNTTGGGTSYPAGVWSFSPGTLSFTLTSAAIVGRAGLSATLVDEGGAPAVLFAGGSNQGGEQLDDAELVRADGTVVPLAMTVPRSFHTAHRVARDGNPAVVLIGGVAYDPALGTFESALAASSARNSIELFLPTGSTAGSGCATGSGPRFCSPTANTMGFQRGAHASVLYRQSGAETIWIAGGAGQDSLTGTGTVALNSCELLDVATFGFAPDSAVATALVRPMAVVTGATGNGALDGRPFLIGGDATLNGNDPQAISYYRESTGTRQAITSVPPTGRADGRAVFLRDGSIRVIGGRTPSAAGGSAGTDEFLAANTSGANVGTWGTSFASAGSRYGHTATVLEGTHTWLDGAVLVTGLAGGAAGPAEILVPSYRCDPDDHRTPVTGNAVAPFALPPLSNPALPPLCDRDRASEPVTDPVTGTAH